MRRTLLLISLVALAGCDPSGVEYTDPDDLRLEIVSGDGQVASVQEGSAYRLSADVPAGTLPDTLVARIRDASGGHANVPPNTVVNYVVPTDGCGAPWVSAASPDDSAYVATLWEKPDGLLPEIGWQDVDGVQVWGSRCVLEARTAVDGQFTTDTTFQAVFTPGAPTHSFLPGYEWSSTGTLTFGERAISDRNGNVVPWVIHTDCCATPGGDLTDMNRPRSLTADSVGEGTAVFLGAAGDTLAAGTLTVSEVEGYLRVTVAF